MIILPILLITILSASANQIVEKYCFSSPGKMQHMFERTKLLLLPQDKFDKDGECFSLSINEERIELIQKYIINLDPQVKIAFSSLNVTPEICHLKVETVRFSNTSNTNIDFSENSSTEALNTKNKSQDIMNIDTTKNFELTVNQEAIKGTCKYHSKDRYNITITVRKDPNLTRPTIPAGTVMTNPGYDPNKIEEGSSLSTEIQITRGQRVELGGLIQNINNKNQTISNSGIDHSTTDKKMQEQVYISIQ